MKAFANVLIASLLLAWSGWAMAGNARAEISAAITHAQMAASAATLSVSHTHLHHVVNCLVGPEASAFSAKSGNPCKGMGKGALDDASAAQQKALQQVLTTAEKGTESASLEVSHQLAGKAVSQLQAILQG